MSVPNERDYQLGTNDEEIERLALQHRVWRPRASEAWRRAGFSVGQSLLDVGCGPGHAAVDLAEIVGPTGRVIAMDRSRRFLDFLEQTRTRRGLGQIEVRELDLDVDPLPEVQADGAWCRWVFAFVRGRRELLARLGRAIRPGGVAVFHEYYDYRTWRYVPRSAVIEEFVQAVMAGWRANGGEPDVGIELPRWLEEEGFEIRALESVIHMVPPANFVWQWARAFLTTGPERMVELGQLTRAQAGAIAKAHAALEADPRALLVTPAVVEIIAVRR